MTITRDNTASFHVLNAQSPTLPNSEASPWPSVYTAVAGSPQPVKGSLQPQKFVPGLKPGQAMILSYGQNNGGTAQDTFVAARTAVGLDASGRYLFLMTIDGIEGATPPYGSNFYDEAEWLKLAGASDGVNLDGGGSTAMAIRVGRDKSLVNVPHGSEGPPYVQRKNAQFFGVIPGIGAR